MPEALAEVKRELGPDAVILGTRSIDPEGLGRLVGRRQIEITASRHAPGAPTAAPRRDAVCPAALLPYYTRLVQNEVGEALAARLMRDAARESAVRGAAGSERLREHLCDFVARSIPVSEGIDLPAGARKTVALVGPAGGGKTTTLAKLAAWFRLRQGREVALLTLDTQRLGAEEQLRRYAELIKVPMESAQSADGVRESRARHQSTDLLLIDTPGVGWRDGARLAHLAEMLAAAKPDEVHLVLPVSMNAGPQLRAAQAFADLGVSRVILTRLDEAVGFGVVLNALQQVQWRLSYLTTGQAVPSDIEKACGHHLATLAFRGQQGVR